MSWDVDGQRKKFYPQRIGKVYGCWKVVGVEWNEDAKNQLWTLECVNCGKTMKTYKWKHLRDSGRGYWCECCKNIHKREREEDCKKHIGEIHNDKEIIGYENGKYITKCIKCGRVCSSGVKPTLEDRLPKCTCSVNQIKYDESYIGKRYGHLEVVAVERKKISNKNTTFFVCKCDCGNEARFEARVLVKKANQVCGVKCKFYDKSKIKHTTSARKILYLKYYNIITRCTNKNNPKFALYGGRGIKVCGEWLNSFESFYNWSIKNGFKKGLTIDRIDPDGNYEPSNCRYITLAENSRLARPRYSVRPYLKK